MKIDVCIWPKRKGLVKPFVAWLKAQGVSCEIAEDYEGEAVIVKMGVSYDDSYFYLEHGRGEHKFNISLDIQDLMKGIIGTQVMRRRRVLREVLEKERKGEA